MEALNFPPDVMRKRVEEVLDLLSLSALRNRSIATLSGGEQQRLVIARALLNDPKVVLADEPTGNLDPEISDDVMTLLHKICSEGTSVIMATHDYRLIQKFGGTIYQVKDQKLTQINDFAQLNW
jgi:energy-coupling factor transport system ATP-binding protein